MYLIPYAMYEASYEEYDSYIRKPYDPSELSTYEYHEKKEPVLC